MREREYGAAEGLLPFVCGLHDMEGYMVEQAKEAAPQRNRNHLQKGLPKGEQGQSGMWQVDCQST